MLAAPFLHSNPMKQYSVNVDKLGADYHRGDTLPEGLLSEADAERLLAQGLIIDCALPAKAVPDDESADDSATDDGAPGAPTLEQLKFEATALGISPLPRSRVGLTTAIDQAKANQSDVTKTVQDGE